MKFKPFKVARHHDKDHTRFLDSLDNLDSIDLTVCICADTKIFNTTFHGPFYADSRSQIGPDLEVGKYTGVNKDCFIARGTVGSYCAIGARVAINPFNHPTNWLSTNEFQYHPKSFDWVDEYVEFDRLARTPDMFEETHIGNDVWIGHGAVVTAGVNVGHGAVIGANAVVTKDVAPYAIVAGAPARVIAYRFKHATVQRLLKVRWWDFELCQLSGMDFRNVEACLEKLEMMRGKTENAG
jgi:acetyltransferase-like isoleucine patch superfamily enzyme